MTSPFRSAPGQATRRQALAYGLAAVAVGSTGGTALADPATHTVQARGVKFAPMFIYIEPGDTVAWENMPSHNIETIDEMVPEGQTKVMSALGENYFTTFDTVGIVVYKCTPHWGARMGGIIVVGKPDNPEGIIDAYMDSTEEFKQNLPARGLLKKLKKDMQEKGLLA
ncbi:MAG: plastocyanin/azurin family copper-binding protein [Pseudomonadota bacterium]